MAGQIGRILGTSALAALLAGTVGTAAAQDSGGGSRHTERFTDHELRMCQGAAGLTQNLNTGEIKALYLTHYYAFHEVIEVEPIEVFTDRVYLMFHNLSRDEIKALADSCASALHEDAAPARFVLSRADIIGEGPFAAFTASRAAERAAAERGRLAYEQEERERQRADAERVDRECGAILNAGVEKATKNFRQAQSEIQVWIRAGAFGSAPGSYDIQNGCNAIDSAGSQLNANQCPAEYAQALMNFRAGYFINFNSGSGYACD